MTEPPPPDSPEAWADLLKSNWDARARSVSRDFYVASHPGWQQREIWENQATADTRLLLSELESEWLADADVLEIGCGVGRLAPHLLAKVRSYTGFDIAPAMVAEARSRLAGEERARFFESDGLGVPALARDREYDLIVALAVFIHCPRDVVQRLAGDAFSLLRTGGRLRFQLLADPSDDTGMEAPPDLAAVAHGEIIEMQEAATPTDMELIEDHYYMGQAFLFDDAKELFESLGGSLALRRFDLGHIYGDLVKE